MNAPTGVVGDSTGNLVFADTNNNRVRVVAGSSGTFYGQAMTVGDIYTVAGDGQSTYSGDGGPAASASVSSPFGVTTDGAGNLVIADTGNIRIRVVPKASGTFYGQAMTADDIYTVAGDGSCGFSGDGGPGTSAELCGSTWVAADGAGNLLIADLGNGRVRKLSG